MLFRLGVAAGVAILAIGGLVLSRRDAEDSPPGGVTFLASSSTVECKGSTALLRFDPSGRIEVSVDGVPIAWADASRRGLNERACTHVPRQQGWDTRITYHTRRDARTLTCRFPGTFFVHVHPLSPSWAGERPAGSAVYLVLGKRVGPGTGPNRTIVASAGVLRRPEQSDLAFAPAYCALT